MSVTLLIGTTKGAFVLNDLGGRWEVDGPHCDGAAINHCIGAGGTIWAAGKGEMAAQGVWRSADRGQSWHKTEFGSEGPETFWSLHFAHGRLYAGAKPASLYVSEDRGVSWALVEALSGHDDAKDWQPGGAGLVLHTILSHPDDPSKLWVGMSAVGVYATEDTGRSWERRNRLSNADTPTSYAPEGEIFSCVHNMQRASDGRLYQQNHQGTFVSHDGALSWRNVTAGLPSDFGFPIGVHPRDPEVIWCFPLNGDDIGRYPPGAAAAVWRSSDGGESWERFSDGLPQEACYMTVLRQAMAVDAEPEVGVYFGTNSGSVFASRDAGESWDEIARHLPTVLSVEVMR